MSWRCSALTNACGAWPRKPNRASPPVNRGRSPPTLPAQPTERPAPAQLSPATPPPGSPPAAAPVQRDPRAAGRPRRPTPRGAEHAERADPDSFAQLRLGVDTRGGVDLRHRATGQSSLIMAENLASAMRFPSTWASPRNFQKLPRLRNAVTCTCMRSPGNTGCRNRASSMVTK